VNKEITGIAVIIAQWLSLLNILLQEKTVADAKYLRPLISNYYFSDCSFHFSPKDHDRFRTDFYQTI